MGLQELRVNELNIKIKGSSESCLLIQMVLWLFLKLLYNLRQLESSLREELSSADDTGYSIKHLPACFQNICFSYKKVYTAAGTLFSRKLDCNILILFPFFCCF